MYQTKREYRCNWLKIFHHNINKGVFKDEKEAKFSLENQKFSILGLINDNYRIDGKFEFLLEYPDNKNKTGMNRWAQSVYPLEMIEKNNVNVEGYEPVTLSWEVARNIANDQFKFCGLSLSIVNDITLIDGACTSDAWFFSIGLYQRHEKYDLPGYGKNEEVILWLRIDSLSSSLYHNKTYFILLVINSFFLIFLSNNNNKTRGYRNIIFFL